MHLKNNSDSVYAVGRRKEALAKVRLSKGEGQIIINGKPIGEYFLGPVFQKQYLRPLEKTLTLGKFTISVKVEGGGKVAQLSAVIHGIARALVIENQSLKVILRKEGYLTRDARVKERRKYGHAGKARARKQSPKR